MLKKIPPGIISVKSRKFTWKGGDYLRVEVTILDRKALQSLDLDQYADVASPEVIKAGKILQRYATFDPEVLRAAQSHLPKGMISAGGGEVAGGVENNQNFNKGGYVPGKYWPIAFIELKERLEQQEIQKRQQRAGHGG
jgi:hypothetical protein